MYPRYMASVKRPKLVFHLVVWGERECELVSVSERVSASSLCVVFPLFSLLQRFTLFISIVISTLLYQLNPLCCSPPIPLVHTTTKKEHHSFILHCPCITIKSRTDKLSLDFSVLSIHISGGRGVP